MKSRKNIYITSLIATLLAAACSSAPSYNDNGDIQNFDPRTGIVSTNNARIFLPRGSVPEYGKTQKEEPPIIVPQAVPTPIVVVVAEPVAPPLPIPAPKVIPLKRDAPFAVLFKHNDATLSAPAKKILKAKLSKIQSAEKVLIQGFADRRGDSQRNMRLSDERAKNVAAYLSENGIPAEKMEIAAYGDQASRSSSCAKKLSKKQAIKCLFPDRRAEIVLAND